MNFRKTLSDIESLVEKFIYPTITRFNISYLMRVMSQFIPNFHIDHWNVVISILRYLKWNPRQRLLYKNKRSLRILWLWIPLNPKMIEWMNHFNLPISISWLFGSFIFLPPKVKSKSDWLSHWLHNIVYSWKSKKWSVVYRCNRRAE